MDILIKNMNNKPKNCILEEHLSDGTVIKHEVVELPPHGRLVDIDRMIADGRKGRKDVFPVIESMDDLADFLETYADLDKTDHTVVLEAST